MSMANWTIAIASLSLILGTAGARSVSADEVIGELDTEIVAQGADEPASRAEASQRQPERALEEITITGSLVPRLQLDGPNSVDVIDRLEIEALGVQNPIDLIERLTYNSGSQSRSDAFRFGGGYGTAQVNLRGLGLGTTLVLVDGRRRAIAGTVANDGSTFVDVNTISLSTIERVEVLKEGAAATYGSDAVAGVVNFITRKDIEGFELRTDYQTTRGGQVEQGLAGLTGWTSGNGRTHVQLGGSYFDSNQLNTTERGFTQALRDENGRIIRPVSSAGVDANFSLAGGPGAFFTTGPPSSDLDLSTQIVPGGPTVGEAQQFINSSRATNNAIPVIDPGCEAANGSANLTNPGRPGTGFCAIEFVDNFNINEHEQRAKYNLLFTHDFSETLSTSFKLDWAYNKIDDVGLSPSFPPVTPFFVPVANPGNFTGENLVQSRSGRPLGENSRTERGFYYTRDLRGELGFKGELFDGWQWDLNTGYNEALRHADIPDTLQREYQNSLFGFGGSGCDVGNRTAGLAPNAAVGVSTVDQITAATGLMPGQGPCQFFNPFASAFLNPDGQNINGQTLGNPQDVIDGFTGRLKTDVTTDLLYVDGLLTGELMDLPAGPVGVAFGYQYRRETFKVERNANQTLVVNEQGQVVNAVTGFTTGRFLFLGGGDEVDTELSVAAVFSEVVIPATERMELQLAVRYEDYNGSIGSSVDPKLGVRYDASDWLTLRGSFSTTFRAPRLNQLGGQATVQENLTSGVNVGGVRQDSGFKAVDRLGNPNLKPEEADVYNFGAILRPFEGLNLTADYFRIDFENAVQAQVPQSLINAEERMPGNAALIAAGNTNFCNESGFTPTGNIVRNPDCSVSRVRANFVNNQSIILDGIDLGMTWDMDIAGLDSFRLFSDLTHLIQFDVADGGGTVKAAGSLNDRLFVSSLPKWRVNAGVQGSIGSHSAGLTLRYISGYEDDRNNTPAGGSGRNVGSHNEVDLSYAYDLQRYDATLQLGVFNVLDNEPPFVDLNFNYDTRVVDARGRRFYTNLIWRF